MSDKHSVLVVDDNPEVAQAHAQLVEELGYRAIVQTDPGQVENQIMNDNDIHVVLLDIRMPKLNGIELLKNIKLQKPQVGVIMATVVNDIEHAVRATKCGAYNYLLKPLKLESLKRVLTSYLQNHPSLISSDPRLSNFMTKCPSFKEIFRRVKTFAEANIMVLIEGETGTGKELIAQLIHTFSPRNGKPFVSINVAALSEQIFESELFGHCKGAFTGAMTDYAGYLEASGDGTLFLDEIGELGLEQQKKLLRVLQTNSYTRLGETKTRYLKSRVIFATNRNLRKEIEENHFRDDLYYRLSSHVISLPPLRDRQGDVELLAKYFLEKYCAQYGRSIEGIEEESLDILQKYPYPGNVRELEGIISGAVLIEQCSEIQPTSLPSHVVYNQLQTKSLESSKFREIMKAMAECQGNQTHAARKLGIARGTLNRWLKEFRESGQHCK